MIGLVINEYWLKANKYIIVISYKCPSFWIYTIVVWIYTLLLLRVDLIYSIFVIYWTEQGNSLIYVFVDP